MVIIPPLSTIVWQCFPAKNSMHNTSPVPKYHFLGSADWIKSRWITRLIYATLSQFHYSLVQSLVAPSPFLGPISVKPRHWSQQIPRKCSWFLVNTCEYCISQLKYVKIEWLETVGNTMKYHFLKSEFVPKKSRLECPEWLLFWLVFQKGES
jgi:hypothetical protein